MHMGRAGRSTSGPEYLLLPALGRRAMEFSRPLECVFHLLLGRLHRTAKSVYICLYTQAKVDEIKFIMNTQTARFSSNPHEEQPFGEEILGTSHL